MDVHSIFGPCPQIGPARRLNAWTLCGADLVLVFRFARQSGRGPGTASSAPQTPLGKLRLAFVYATPGPMRDARNNRAEQTTTILLRTGCRLYFGLEVL